MNIQNIKNQTILLFWQEIYDDAVFTKIYSFKTNEQTVKNLLRIHNKYLNSENLSQDDKIDLELLERVLQKKLSWLVYDDENHQDESFLTSEARIIMAGKIN